MKELTKKEEDLRCRKESQCRRESCPGPQLHCVRLEQAAGRAAAGSRSPWNGGSCRGENMTESLGSEEQSWKKAGQKVKASMAGNSQQGAP